MLARIEIFLGVALFIVLCVLAGYSVVSGIIAIRAHPQVRACVAQSMTLAHRNGKSASEEVLIGLCERIIEAKPAL